MRGTQKNPKNVTLRGKRKKGSRSNLSYITIKLVHIYQLGLRHLFTLRQFVYDATSDITTTQQRFKAYAEIQNNFALGVKTDTIFGGKQTIVWP